MARVFLSPNYNNPNGLDPGMARDESQRALDTIEKIEGYEGWEVANRARPLLFACSLQGIWHLVRGRFFNIIETFQHNHNVRETRQEEQGQRDKTGRTRPVL